MTTKKSAREEVMGDMPGDDKWWGHIEESMDDALRDIVMADEMTEMFSLRVAVMLLREACERWLSREDSGDSGENNER